MFNTALRSYVTLTQLLKSSLRVTGLLQKLDEKAREDRRYHYWRSLLALHQLDDMIALDVPWWTYPAIDWVDHYLISLPHPANVFEYGSGASTLWLAKRAGQMVSVEHNPQWYYRLQSAIERLSVSNVSLMHVPPKDFTTDNQNVILSGREKNLNFADMVNTIHQMSQPYDVIIIDGRCREACLKIAVEYLKPTGIIVFDNTDRKRYQAALQDCPLELLRLKGRVPGSPIMGETSVLKNVYYKAESFINIF